MYMVWHYLKAQNLYPLLIGYDMQDVRKMISDLSSKYRMPIFGNPNHMIVDVILTMTRRSPFHCPIISMLTIYRYPTGLPPA